MAIKENLEEVLATLPPEVRLVAVSKYHPSGMIMEAYHAGQRIFGENKVQEMTAKAELLPKDIEWHFIGHLQTNKIKYMIPYVAMIQGVDSWKGLVEIDKQAAKHNRIVPCLLQIHIAQEETKFGFSFEECLQMLEGDDWKALTHIDIQGLMGMASNTDNMEQVRSEFRSLHDFFLKLKEKFFGDAPSFKELSMGMTHDYPIAVEEGATLVRIGTKIFGEREYN